MSYRLLSVCAVVVGTQACNHGAPPAPESARNETNTPSASTTPSTATGEASASTAMAAQPVNPVSDKPSALSDEQVAAITNDANSAEIEQAQLAESKARDARVKDFAAMMVKHHTEAKNKQAKLGIKTASSSSSEKLEKDAQDTLTKLKSLTSKDFDAAYIDAQVDEHQEVATTIERDLMPSAKSADLKAYLAEIKPTVESHLKKAKEIQSALRQTASTK